MQHGLLKAIRYFGTQKDLAKVLGVKQQAVSNWLNRQCHIPYAHVIKIVCLTKGHITPQELAPDDPLNKGIFELLEVLQAKENNKHVETEIAPPSLTDQPKQVKTSQKDTRFKIDFEHLYKRKNSFSKMSKKLQIHNYVKICAHFWEEVVNKKMKRLRGTLVVVSLYVQTCRHANIIGIYQLPISYIACDTGLEEKEVRVALKYLQKVNFCSYDKDKEYIWVHQMAIDQIGESIEADEKLAELINSFIHSLPELTFLNKFYEVYRDRLLLTPRQ